MIETISGIITAVLIIIICRLLSKHFNTKLMAATILVAIAFIYVGFSLKEDRVGLIVMEIVFALGLYFMAIIGFTKNALLLGYGIILHGIWDILHHKGIPINTDVPGFWPSFCFIIDIIDGIYFLVVFRKEKSNTLKLTANA
jgi:hypothetical protein